MSLSDHDVVSCLRLMSAGDVAALEEIYKAFQRNIFDIALKKLHGNRAVAEDIVQQTFEALIRDPGGYDPRKGPFIAWLQGIAHFKVMDHFRAAGRFEASNHPNDEDVSEGAGVGDYDAGEPGSAVDEATRRNALLKCLDKLPHEQRDTIISSWLKEMTYADVASMLGTEVGTVKSRIHNAMKRLRDCLVIKLGAGAWQ